jgi:RNA polymerase sigma factor (sigma-70 family)
MSAASFTFYSGYANLSGVARGAKPSLLAQARRGNADAFAEMVSPHMLNVYQRARRLTGNPADAEDVSQEALLKAWSRLDQFSGSQGDHADDFRAWLSRIAGNTSIDLLRQRRDGKIVSLEERQGPDQESLGSGIPMREHNPEERCARRESGRLLADAIRQLPADLRQACLLRDVMQYSTQEVADRLGISVVAVRLRLFRAHRRLREKLEPVTRPPVQRSDHDASGVRTTHRRNREKRRSGFVPLHPLTEYACGD